ncbi:MAG: peroxide stress protein YaaA [Propionicimonas sp.]|uniref:peroxide stress protein YaaA n=1 Tax=Propionicimonas sp. TaxID=1955623 RepID=UPI002B1FAC0F|nr:peroxide stress protein YaaA [Propionicimonas sp.]MEA4944458.1 peroxide stress protein YaaA [Propionicimonas sp.]MEA5119161.1 peroxide stress protein YaaA [Propionicimonas sp.]
MLILLSPAKALDVTSPLPKVAVTQPRLLAQAEELAAVMRTRSVADLAALSGISDELAALNAGRWADFHTPFTRRNARPAVLAFNGDVYQGLDARHRFDTRDYTEAQKTVRILSGLYGVLRPLDLIQPYRLEMGTRLETDRGRSLYEWWGTTITDLLGADLASSPGADVVVNLASAEYSGAVDAARLGAPVVSPRFEDTDARGRRTVISFYAKRARGELAAWLVARRARTASVLKRFDGAGYRYDKTASTAQVPVFVRAFANR